MRLYCDRQVAERRDDAPDRGCVILSGAADAGSLPVGNGDKPGIGLRVAFGRGRPVPQWNPALSDRLWLQSERIGPGCCALRIVPPAAAALAGGSSPRGGDQLHDRDTAGLAKTGTRKLVRECAAPGSPIRPWNLVLRRDAVGLLGRSDGWKGEVGMVTVEVERRTE